MRHPSSRGGMADNTRWGLLTWTPLFAACGVNEPGPPPSCAPGEELFRGRCVNPAARYEPEERIDQDNVVAFGEPLTRLALPDPPRSGFRIIAPPRALQPGEEVSYCLSWPFPDIRHKTIYAARVYTTPGLHHSNVISKPVNPDYGPNPYPDCHPGAEDPFGGLPFIIPDVLFASSTQIASGEALVFPPGMGFTVDTSKEISTDIHLLNASAEPTVVEVAYDFFTMPDAEREEELVPFVMSVNDFLVPPHSTGVVGATCPTYGGNIVSLMPHTHRYADAFTVDVVSKGGSEVRVYEGGEFDLESDIQIYRPAITLEEGGSLRYACTFRNTSSHDLVFGIGDNEMCMLFGYLYPAEKQFVSFSAYQGKPCYTLTIGGFR